MKILMKSNRTIIATQDLLILLNFKMILKAQW